MKSEKSIIYKIATYIAMPFYAILIKTKSEGEHFIPTKGPIILVSNHISFLDPLAIGFLARRRKRQISFLAKGSLFKNPVLRWFFYQCHQIPVYRDSDRAADSLIEAENALANGACICFYPEATISSTEQLLPIKSGAIRLAQKTGVEIVVVGTYGAHRVWTKGSRFKFKFRTKHTMILSKAYKIDPKEDIESAKMVLAERMKVLADLAKQRQGK